MGWWKTSGGVIGDEPADLCDRFLQDIEALYEREMGRLPSQGEIADTIEFCTGGILKVACGDPKHPFSTETIHGDGDTPRAAGCGEKGALADAARPPSGGLVNVDPTTGEHL